MAKELPYYQFEPAEYLTKDISFCSLAVQGLFANVCAYYWQRKCELTRTQFLRRLNHPNEFNILVDEGIIDLNKDDISIKFLDAQYEKATDKSKTNSVNGSKGGRPRKIKPIETELKPNKNLIESENISESKGIREEKIREEDSREDKITDKRFSFRKSLSELGIEKTLVDDFLKNRKLKKLANTETAFKMLVIEFNKNEIQINNLMTKIVSNGWGSFKNSWLEKEKSSEQKETGTVESIRQRLKDAGAYE